MASVNFMKLKGPQIKQVVRHVERENRHYSNPDIDRSLSKQNGHYRHGGLEEVIRAYEDRIRELDETTNHNHRKDRVTAFALEAPIPAGVPAIDAANLITRCVVKQYGKDNLIQSTLHVDEKHEYMDHGQLRQSLDHVHLLVVPEIDGQLNGKRFSSKQQIRQLNQSIDDAFWERFGVHYMTGEKTKTRSKTIEDLKLESYKELVEEVDRLNELCRQLLPEEELPYPQKKTLLGKEYVQVPADDFRRLRALLGVLKGVDLAAAYETRDKALAEAQEAVSAAQKEADKILDAARREAHAQLGRSLGIFRDKPRDQAKTAVRKADRGEAR